MGDPLSEEVVKWLDKLHLQPYSEQVRAWCNESGAVSVAEILENLDDFATKLKLKKLERKRVEKELTQGAAAPTTPTSKTPAAAAAAPAAEAPSKVMSPSRGEAKGYFGPPDNPQKYSLGRELGQGATAIVYECWCGDKSYAAKTMSLAKLRLQPGFQRMADTLRREVAILFQLRHPRIVSLFDVVEVQDRGGKPEKLHLVMDMVPGGELFDRIVEAGAFQEQPTAKYVFVQIAEGLKYIHSKDIVYRDLKPENILVDERNSRPGFLEIKLSDFGHSKLINDGYSTALTRVGTPQYWAPEVSDPRMAALGYTQQVDLWSLGVVLYVMLIGAYPFDGMSSTIEDQIQRARIEFRQSALGHQISDGAKELISSLIKVEPKDRLPLEKCLVHSWAVSSTSSIPMLLKTETEINPRGLEERVKLPAVPSKEKVQDLRRDLNHWMNKWKSSAKVANGEVIATMRDDVSVVGPEHIRQAKEELRALVDYNFRDFQGGSPPPVATAGGYPGGGAGLAPVKEEAQTQRSFRMLSYNLRVDPKDGAGLDLQPERGGMRVEGVCDKPGQPGLARGDLMIKINEVSLRGNAERVEALFGREFKDGVQVSVKRFT